MIIQKNIDDFSCGPGSILVKTTNLDSFQGVAAVKSSAPFPLPTNCGSASVCEAVIHKQPRLIKRLSQNIPPQWVAWLSAAGTDRNTAEFYCPKWTLLSFHITSSHLFSFCFVTLSIPILAGLLRVFDPLNPLKVCLGLSSSAIHQRNMCLLMIRELRLQTVGLWLSKQGVRERARLKSHINRLQDSQWRRFTLSEGLSDCISAPRFR